MVQIESIAAMSKQDVMLEIGSKKVIAAKYSSEVYSDHYGACDLIERVDTKYNISTIYADRSKEVIQTVR